MTLQSSGEINFYQINAEFGRGYNLYAYRNTTYYYPGSGGYTFSGGEIHFSDFFGTQSYYNGGGPAGES